MRYRSAEGTGSLPKYCPSAHGRLVEIFSIPSLIGCRVLPMAYGFGLLCLMLYKAIEFWKLSARFNGLSLVRILIQDQVLYYAL